MQRASTVYKIIASDQITIQVQEDNTLYRLELVSSAGEMITPDVKSTTITATLIANREDITDKISNITWKKYLYDLDVPVLQDKWGEDKDGLTSIVLEGEDIFVKCKIECEAYVTSESGTEYRVAGSYIVLVDVNDLRPSDTPPDNPKEGQLWLDTSVTPPVLRVYINGEWVVLNKTEIDIEELIEGLKKADQKIEDLKNEIEENNLLFIDNTQDYLFEYFKSVSSTNGVCPNQRYRASFHKGEGKFNNCIYIDILDKWEVIYHSKVLSSDKDFTISMWCKPGDNTVANNNHKLLTTGDDTDSTFFTLWNMYPDITDPQDKDRRLCIDFGIDVSGNRQFTELVDTNKIKDWTMITISYEHAKNEFAIYKDGLLWGLKTISKVHPVSYFGMKRSGWFYENIVILNKLLTPKQIKAVYDKNRPFVDNLQKTIDAPAASMLEFNMN